MSEKKLESMIEKSRLAFAVGDYLLTKDYLDEIQGRMAASSSKPLNAHGTKNLKN